jgi:hypothetical protein
VDVSVDAAAPGRPPRCGATRGRSSAGACGSISWTPPREAYYSIFARARDAAGNTQPLEQEWNPSGYGWNVVPRIGIVVDRSATVSGSTPGDATPITAPTTLKSTCLSCHDEDVIASTADSRAMGRRDQQDGGWGAKVPDTDRSALLDYFASRYGPRPR